MKTAEEFCEDNHWAPLAAEGLKRRDTEWRRLVEEAQADAKNALEVGLKRGVEIGELKAERDRLKGELAEARRSSAMIQQDLIEAHWRLSEINECDNCAGCSRHDSEFLTLADGKP